MLVSSHLMSELQDTADHLVVIGRGRLIADTSVRDLLGARRRAVRSARRTDPRQEAMAVLAHAGRDGLLAPARTGQGLDPQELIRTVSEASDLTLPGWEPEKLDRITELFEAYEEVDEEQLWANLEIF